MKAREIIILMLTILPIASAVPVFVDPIDDQDFVVEQDERFIYYINVTDPQGHYPIALTDSSHDSAIGFYCFDKQKIGPSEYVMNFSASNEDVGNYTFSLIAENNASEKSIIDLNFIVNNLNDAPTISSVSPDFDPYVMENQSIQLGIVAKDADIIHGDNLTFSWYLDSMESQKLHNISIRTQESDVVYSPNISHFDAGIHNISVVVQDSAGASVNHSWKVEVINVNRPPYLNRNLPNITWPEDTSLDNNLSLMDYFIDPDTNGSLCEVDTGNCLGFASIVGDRNVSISIDENGTVDFSAAEDWFGTTTALFNVTDGNLSATSNEITLNVTNVNDMPEIESLANLTTYENTHFSYAMSATDADNDVLSYSLNSSFPKINIDNESAIISISSLSGDAGTYNAEVNVSDGQLIAGEAFLLHVLPNERPSINQPGNISVAQHSYLDLIIEGTDADGDNITIWSNTSILPNRTRINETTWNFSFVPRNQSHIGNHSIMLLANDSKNSLTNISFNLEITDTPMPPELYAPSIPNSQLRNMVEYQDYVEVYDEDGDVDSVYSDMQDASIEIIQNSSIREPAIARISYTPNSTGMTSITIYANDSRGSSNSTVITANVTYNHEPVFTSAHDMFCEEDKPCTQTIEAEDYDWQDSLDFFHEEKFDFNMSTEGEVSFIPSEMKYYPVEIWVTDGNLTARKNITINVTEIDAAPYFRDNLSQLAWNESRENKTSLIEIVAMDEEHMEAGKLLNLSVEFINFTNLAGQTEEGRRLFSYNNTYLDANQSTVGIIEFTPDWDDVGVYWLEMKVSDNNTVTSQRFSIRVGNINNPPVITWTMEYNSSTYGPSNASSFNHMTIENTTVLLNATVTDFDFDDANLSWESSLNGSISKRSHISYTFPFDSYPEMDLTLIADDGEDQSMTKWTFNVSNVNRNITFGVHEYTFNESDSCVNCTITPESLTLSRDGENYSRSGVYESYPIDFETSSKTLPRISYDRIILEVNNSLNHTINFSTASVNNLDFIPEWIDSTNGIIDSPDYRFLYFRLYMQGANQSHTPNITGVRINYSIADQSSPESTEYTDWLDLSKFFHDPDYDDNISYDYRILSSTGSFNITIMQERFASIRFIDEGEAFVQFNATDEWNSTAWSNIINISITGAQSESSSTGGQTSSSSSTDIEIQTQTEYKYREEEKPVSLDIIHPEGVTIFKNETIRIPLILENDGDRVLKGLYVDAFSDRGGLNITLERNYLDMLGVGNSVPIMLEMAMTEVFDSYDVHVTVNVTEPDYDDSAKILVSSLKRSGDSKEANKMKLSFVSDLLKKNEECAELSEYIKRARQHSAAGDYQKSNELLNQFTNDCKLLMEKTSTRENPENLANSIYSRVMRDTQLLIIVITTLVLVLGSITVALVMAYRKI